MTGSAIATIILCALLVEGIVEGVKTAYPALDGRTGAIYIVCVVVSLVCCFGVNAGIFGVLGVSCNRYIDTAITALIVARGSNHVFDIFERFAQNWKKADGISGTDEQDAPHGYTEEGRG